MYWFFEIYKPDLWIERTMDRHIIHSYITPQIYDFIDLQIYPKIYGWRIFGFSDLVHHALNSFDDPPLHFLVAETATLSAMMTRVLSLKNAKNARYVSRSERSVLFIQMCHGNWYCHHFAYRRITIENDACGELQPVVCRYRPLLFRVYVRVMGNDSFTRLCMYMHTSVRSLSLSLSLFLSLV